MIARILIATLLVLGIDLSFAQTNYISQKAVGYVKITAKPRFTFVRYDFVSIDQSIKRTQDLFDALPLGSTVWRYDSSLPHEPRWIPNNKSGIPSIYETWGPLGHQHIVQRGDAFLIELHAFVLPTEVFLLGEIPDDGTFLTTATHPFSGYGYPYPVTIEWDSSAISSNVPIGSVAWRYENGTGWHASNKSGVPGVFHSWSDWNFSTGATKQLDPGEGVLLQVLGGPYTAEEIQLYVLQAP